MPSMDSRMEQTQELLPVKSQPQHLRVSEISNPGFAASFRHDPSMPPFFSGGGGGAVAAVVVEAAAPSLKAWKKWLFEIPDVSNDAKG